MTFSINTKYQQSKVDKKKTIYITAKKTNCKMDNLFYQMNGIFKQSEKEKKSPLNVCLTTHKNKACIEKRNFRLRVKYRP